MQNKKYAKQIPMKLFISLTIILLTIPSLSFWLGGGGEIVFFRRSLKFSMLG
jgi:hypothetical protein